MSITRENFNDFKRIFWDTRHWAGRVLLFPCWITLAGFLVITVVADFFVWLERSTRRK